jgi:hypothetical protein
MQHSAGPNFAIEYLSEFEADFENISWCSSVAYGTGDRLAKKPEEKSRKSRDIVYLRCA